MLVGTNKAICNVEGSRQLDNNLYLVWAASEPRTNCTSVGLQMTEYWGTSARIIDSAIPGPAESYFVKRGLLASWMSPESLVLFQFIAEQWAVWRGKNKNRHTMIIWATKYNHWSLGTAGTAAPWRGFTPSQKLCEQNGSHDGSPVVRVHTVHTWRGLGLYPGAEPWNIAHVFTATRHSTTVLRHHD